MKKFSLMTTIIIVGFIIQTSFFNFLNIFGTIPNISLTILVIFALMSDSITGGVLGIITGILYDTMLYDVFGVYTLIYFIIGSIIGTYSDDMIRENYAAYTTVTAISTVVSHFLVYLILFFLKYRVGLISNILGSILIEIVINSVLVIFVLKFILLIFNKLNIK